MILTKKVKVKMNSFTKKHYNDLGYFYKVGEEFEILTEHLTEQSHIMIRVKCEICGKERELAYYNYRSNHKNCNFYSCKECKNFKYENTCNEKYGVSNTSKLKETTKKREKTCRQKYGCNNPMQAEWIYKKQQKSGYKIQKYLNIYYRGTYELDFIKFCEKFNIEIKNGDRFSYTYNEKKHKYFPDFFIPEIDTYIEIKSQYTYQKCLHINTLKHECIINQGHNHIFIIDKNYEVLLKLFNNI